MTRGRMTMRALTERRGLGTDPYGQPSGAWATLSASLPCYVWVNTETKRLGDEGVVPTEAIRAVVPRGTDITESDRVLSVQDRRGATLYGVLQIDGVMRRPDHIALRLRRASNAGIP